MKYFYVYVIITFFSGCVTGPSIQPKDIDYSSPIVSMTKKVPTGELKSLGKVEAKYCNNEHELLDRHGMLDEAIKKAQKMKNSDFIVDITAQPPTDFQEREYCVVIKGTAMKTQ